MTDEAPGIEVIFNGVRNAIEKRGVRDDGRYHAFTLKPTDFAKMMKGIDIHDRHNLLTLREIRTYKNMLLKVALYWNGNKYYRTEVWDNGYEWYCEEKGSSATVQLKFTPRRIDEGDK